MLTRRAFIIGSALALAGCDVRRLLIAGGGGSVTIPPRYPPTDASWTRSASNPILSPTEAWEQTAVLENSTVHETPGGWKMWYRGGSMSYALGYATSTDGISWTKYAGNPIYGLGGSGVSGNTGGEPLVLRVGSTYWLYATNNDIPRVDVATSSDGIAWTTQASSISLPSGQTLWGNRVVWIEGATWKMLHETYNGTIWQIFLYTSSDGLTWSIGNSGNPLTTLQAHAGGMYGGPRFASDASGAFTPQFGGVYHLWYHAASGAGVLPTDIYHATSTDLITWTISPATPVLTHLGSGIEFDQVAGPSPVVVGGTAYLFYDGDNNTIPGGGSTSAWLCVATAPAVP